MNDLKEMLCSELHQDYEIGPSETGIILKTPLLYDDGDNVVIIITPQPDHSFILDDNSDTSIRLMFEGVDLDSPPVQIWIKNACAIHQLQWDLERDAFWCKATRQNLVERITRVAQVSIQMQALTVLLSIPEEQTDVSQPELNFNTLGPLLTKIIIAMRFGKQLEQLFNNIVKKQPELQQSNKLFTDFTKAANDEPVPMKYRTQYNNKGDIRHVG